MHPQMPEEHVQRITERLGLDRPLYEQYIDFIIDSLSFDFGQSYQTNIDVSKEIQLAFGPTIMLGFFGTLIGVPLGIMLGAIAGANREGLKDHIIRLYTIGIYSIPIFLVGIFMQIIFTYIFGILPALDIIQAGGTHEFTHYTEIWLIDTLLSGRPDLTLDIIIHLIMPSTALGMLIAGVIARQVRTNMIHQLEQDYVHFSRSRGIPERTVRYKYCLKNAAVPTIGLISLQFALLLAGAILTETTFNIPGLGRYLYHAIQNKDFPAVQGAMVIFVIIVSVISLLGDVLYAVLDPRITY
jgi:peptide/nickel transport system permease protein